jgi:hypothetical protein
MLPGDLLCRAAVHPRLKKENREHFDTDAFLKFAEFDLGQLWKLSLASFWLCRSEKGVHEFGLRVASSGNARKLEKLAKPGATLKPHVPDTYLGYYSGHFCYIGAIKTMYYKSEVRWVPEDGEDCHFELQLSLRVAFETAKVRDYRSDMRTARTQLADILFGPIRLPNPTNDMTLADLQDRFLEVRMGRPFAA